MIPGKPDSSMTTYLRLSLLAVIATSLSSCLEDPFAEPFGEPYGAPRPSYERDRERGYDDRYEGRRYDAPRDDEYRDDEEARSGDGRRDEYSSPATKPKTEYPVAQKTSNPNRVISPYAPYNVVDVEGFRSGQLARDPGNKKIFRVP